jgi:hypothetical protein
MAGLHKDQKPSTLVLPDTSKGHHPEEMRCANGRRKTGIEIRVAMVFLNPQLAVQLFPSSERPATRYGV